MFVHHFSTILTATDPEEYQQLHSNGIVVNTFIKDSLIEDRLAMIDMQEFISTIFDPDPGLTNIPPLSTLPNGILKICEMMEARHNIAVSDTVVAPLPSVFHKLALMASLLLKRCETYVPESDIHILKFITGVDEEVICGCIRRQLFPKDFTGTRSRSFEQDPIGTVREIVNMVRVNFRSKLDKEMEHNQKQISNMELIAQEMLEEERNSKIRAYLEEGRRKGTKSPTSR